MLKSAKLPKNIVLRRDVVQAFMPFNPELNSSECRKKVALESAVFLVVKEKVI